jgi:hypothetical protein
MSHFVDNPSTLRRNICNSNQFLIITFIVDSSLLTGANNMIEDLGSPKLDELYYSDSMADFMKEEKSR